ncbi:MAG: YraN family protein [Candidatus Fimimonas sp.]
MNKRQVGQTGEQMAAKYLQKQGYEILQRNYVAPHGEIDIIAKDGNYVVFVEVKRRKTQEFGLPREAVTLRKQQTIAQCAKLWLAKNKLYGTPVRFDVVDILNDEITLLKDAFRA